MPLMQSPFSPEGLAFCSRLFHVYTTKTTNCLTPDDSHYLLRRMVGEQITLGYAIESTLALFEEILKEQEENKGE